MQTLGMAQAGLKIRTKNLLHQPRRAQEEGFTEKKRTRKGFGLDGSSFFIFFNMGRLDMSLRNMAGLLLERCARVHCLCTGREWGSST